MANETILVVDADEKIQKVLEVSLKKSGYRVLVAETPAAASHIVRTDGPDLIISETAFEGGDGFEFLTELKNGQFASTPFIFLTEDRALPQKMKGFELGADDYLTKPFYLKEITTRADLLIQRRNKEGLTEESLSDEFEGNLADITMIDLLQTIESEHQSGSIQVQHDGNDAVIYFQDGNILDAFCGKLQGEEAIYRLFLWTDGEFIARFSSLEGRPDRIEKNSSELLIEGIRRLDEYQQLTETLPNLQSIFDADFDALAKTGQNFPPEVARIFRLFDGKRSLRNVIDSSALNDVTTLKIINRLFSDQLIVEIEGAIGEPDASNLASWLDDQSDGYISGPSSVVEVDSDKKDRKTERLLDAQRRENTDQLLAARNSTDQHAAVNDWHASSLDEASDAIKEIEQTEAIRREAEATRLSGEFEAVSRDSVPRDHAAKPNR